MVFLLGLEGCGWSGNHAVELAAVGTMLMSYEGTQKSSFSPQSKQLHEIWLYHTNPAIAAVNFQWLEPLPLRRRSWGHHISLSASGYLLEIITYKPACDLHKTNPNLSLSKTLVFVEVTAQYVNSARIPAKHPREK